MSLTYVPYYDAGIVKSKKHMLGEVKLNPSIISKVEAL